MLSVCCLPFIQGFSCGLKSPVILWVSWVQVTTLTRSYQVISTRRIKLMNFLQIKLRSPWKHEIMWFKLQVRLFKTTTLSLFWVCTFWGFLPGMMWCPCLSLLLFITDIKPLQFSDGYISWYWCCSDEHRADVGLWQLRFLNRAEHFTWIFVVMRLKWPPVGFACDVESFKSRSNFALLH